MNTTEKELIYKYLDGKGVLKMWNGYSYLATAIEFCLLHPQSYMKEIYSYTAEIHKVDPTQVLGGIRYAVKNSEAMTGRPKAFIKDACFQISSDAGRRP